jgi:hypothetical protein
MNNISKVEPFASELEATASRMDANGIGGHPTRGHAAILRTMAGDLRAQGALGKMPAVFESINSVADQGDESGELAARRKGRALTLIEAVTAAAGNQTKLQALSNLRARALREGISLDSDSVLTLPAVDAALDKSGTQTETRFALKADLYRAGILAAA